MTKKLLKFLLVTFITIVTLGNTFNAMALETKAVQPELVSTNNTYKNLYGNEITLFTDVWVYMGQGTALKSYSYSEKTAAGYTYINKEAPEKRFGQGIDYYEGKATLKFSYVTWDAKPTTFVYF